MGRQGQSALSNLIERREKSVATNLDLLILLDATYNDGCREPSRFAVRLCGSIARPCLGDEVLGNREATSPRERVSFPCRYQRRRRSIFIAADFHVHFLEGKKMGYRAGLHLGPPSTTVASPMGGGKAKFLRFSKPLAEAEFTSRAQCVGAITASSKETSADHCENRVVAFGAFVKANCRLLSRCPSLRRPGPPGDFVSPGAAPAVITAAALLFLEAAVETKLLGLEWIACQVARLRSK